MRYTLREGIVHTKVCQDHVLVATRDVWGKCPYVKILSPLQAAYWEGLKRNMTEEEIMGWIHLSHPVKQEVLHNLFVKFIDMLKTNGYIEGETE